MRRIIKALLIGTILFTGWVLIAPSLATCLIVEKPIATADAIVVLSGSEAYKERTRKATELYSTAVAPRVFLTDDGGRAGWSRDERVNLPFVELARRELVAGGVPPEAITVLPDHVSGTDQEAKALSAEIDSRSVKSVVLVTSAYHTRRAFRTFDKILAGKGVEIGVVHSPFGKDSPSPDYWWLSLRAWRTIGGEYVKSVVYWAYY